MYGSHRFSGWLDAISCSYSASHVDFRSQIKVDLNWSNIVTSVDYYSLKLWNHLLIENHWTYDAFRRSLTAFGQGPESLFCRPSPLA